MSAFVMAPARSASRNPRSARRSRIADAPAVSLVSTAPKPPICDEIAELRVAYGGRGQITDVQQPRYGAQVLDIVLPF